MLRSRFPGAARRVRRALLAVSVGAAALTFSAAPAAAAPGSTVLTRTGQTTCDRVVLRAGPSGAASRRTSVDTGVDVTITATVTGNSWRITCAGGVVVSGRTWFKIGSVAGVSTAERYGVAYVYAPTGQFATESVAATACLPATLNENPSSLTRRVTRIDPGTVATITATVLGQMWHVRCDGRWLSGNTWYRVSELNGQPLAPRYRTPAAYVASGMLVPLPAPADPATVDPNALPPTLGPVIPAGPVLPSAGIAQGIDVSHHNGPIDWQKVKTLGGKKFVYIKASEATDFVDWTYARNRAGARGAGLLVGAYHFARPGAERGDAIAEADHFMATAQWASGELVPILDLEHTGGLSKSALGAWTLAFLNRVYERAGIRPAIYVSPTFWKKHVGNTTAIAKAGYNILWVAHWTHDEEPRVPAANWAGEGWTVWQFSNRGKVPGIKGRVDFDRMAAEDLARIIIP